MGDLERRNVMARGPYYTPEETRRLQKLIADNPKKTNAELGDMAVAYGMLEYKRTAGAVAQYISILKKPAEDDQAEKQLNIEDTMILGKEVDELRGKLDGLLGAILGTATLAPGGDSLLMNFPAVKSYLYSHYPVEVKLRIEELKEGI